MGNCLKKIGELRTHGADVKHANAAWGMAQALGLWFWIVTAAVGISSQLLDHGDPFDKDPDHEPFTIESTIDQVYYWFIPFNLGLLLPAFVTKNALAKCITVNLFMSDETVRGELSQADGSGDGGANSALTDALRPAGSPRKSVSKAEVVTSMAQNAALVSALLLGIVIGGYGEIANVYGDEYSHAMLTFWIMTTISFAAASALHSILLSSFIVAFFGNLPQESHSYYMMEGKDADTNQVLVGLPVAHMLLSGMFLVTAFCLYVYAKLGLFGGIFNNFIWSILLIDAMLGARQVSDGVRGALGIGNGVGSLGLVSAYLDMCFK
eukprot:g1796.t1